MSSSIDRRAVDLLLSIVESADAKVTGTVLSDYHATSAGKLLAANVLRPDGHNAAAASLADFEDEPVSLIWSSERNGYGYFSPSAGWVDVPKERMGVYGVDFPVLFARLLVGLDIASRGGTRALVPRALWELGDARIGRRPQRVPIWFARRLSDRRIWADVADAARRRPTPHVRILLTSTSSGRLHEPGLPGHLVVSIGDAIDFDDGMAVSPEILSALLDGIPAVSPHAPLSLSPSGQRLTIHGNVTIDLKSDIHIAIIRKLVEGYKDGRRFSARELLDHAHSSAKTLRQAFGAQRWADLEPYLKSENGLWGFAL